MNEIDIQEYRKQVYFSQNREDLVLDSFFHNVKNGFYIDIGGFDPDYDSVTKFFYLKGWHGINIEPQPERYKKFLQERSRDTNIQCGVGSTASVQKLRVYKSGGLSTFSRELKAKYSKEISNQDVAEYDDINVDTMPLSKILDAEKLPDVIHFMKIDVEGFEYEVISGNNWDKYRPHVVCVESNHILRDWRPMLNGAGYVKVFYDGLNDYYCLADSPFRKDFDFVKHVIAERGGGMRYSDFSMISSLSEEVTKYAEQYSIDVAKVKRLENDLTKKARILNSRKALVSRLFDLTFKKNGKHR